MNRTRTALRLLLTAGLLVGTDTAFARRSQQPAPDNTAVNKRDSKAAEPTADQSKNTTSDREFARLIRRDVVKDKTLSVYGHNVKIIAQGGKITLKGPVHTEDEKTIIANYARKRAGAGNVSNELSVKGDGK